MIAAFALTWFFAACLWTLNALRHPVPPTSRFPPLWLPGMIVSELAPVFFVVRALIAWGFIAGGVLDTGMGQLAIGLFALSEMGLLVLMWRSIVAARESGHSPGAWTIPKVYERLPRTVDHHLEVPYWEDLSLDIYARPGVGMAPTLIYVHPGSWMRGRPGRQARAMSHRLAQEGWVVLDIRYPLSPDATFPEHLVGVKRAIAWTRSQAERLGCDPNRVFISGGSSGAHLASLAALTSEMDSLQPGFEHADTSVAGCVPFYGIYDLLVRNPTRYDWPFIARTVMKARPIDAPDLYKLGSPIDQVHRDAPPFLVVHGQLDSIVLPAESHHFTEALESAGVDVVYHEVRGGQHGFDAIASLRTRAVAAMCVEWLNRRAGHTPR